MRYLSKTVPNPVTMLIGISCLFLNESFSASIIFICQTVTFTLFVVVFFFLSLFFVMFSQKGMTFLDILARVFPVTEDFFEY